MSLANDLRERERLAGNADDHLNVGQQQYAERFNRAANKSQAEIDDEFNDIIANNYGEERGDTKVDAHGDTIQRNWNADEPDPTDSLKGKEEKDDTLYQKSQPKNEKLAVKGVIKSRFKRFGPGLFIAGLLGGSVGLGGTLLVPAALGPLLDRIFTNYGADDTRANLMMRRGYLGGVFGSGACSGPAVKCRMTTISQTQKEHWEKRGFEVKTQDAGNGRMKIESLKFPEPDGTEVKSGKELQAHISKNINARQLVHNVAHPKASYFIDQKSKFRKVLSKYGLAHGKIFKASTDRDKAARTQAMNETMDDHTKAVTGDESARASEHKKRITSNSRITGAVRKYGSKITGTADVVTLGCTMYNMVRASIAITKLMWYEDLIRFAFPFMQTFSQIIDQGNVEPERVEYINDRLTWYDNKPEDENGNPNPKHNLTALDSQGLKMALYGDYDALHEFTKPYTSWWISSAVIGSGLVTEAEKLLGGKDNVRTLCLAGQAVSLAGLAFCANPVGALVCAGGIITTLFFGDDIMKELVERLSGPAADAMAKANLTSDLKGVDAGNALAAGIGLLLTEKSRASGLRPASNTNQVKNYIATTDAAYYQDIEEIPRIAAKDKPFDLTNQYSFISQVAKQVEQRTLNSNTAYDVFANIFAFNTSAFALAGTNVNALYHQPNELTNRKGALEPSLSYERCQDQDLKDIQVLCDYTGRPVGVLSENAVDMMNKFANDDVSVLESNVDYMISGDYIDQEGKEKQKGEDGEDNDYVMYKKYCTEDREFPIGVTDKSLDDAGESKDKFEWYIGSRCAGNDINGKALDKAFQEKLDNFFFYYNTCETQYAIADQAEGCWSEASTPPPATSSGGDWVIPTSGQCLSSYGSRWGTKHAGIDISPPSGTPVVAPTDMKIISVGDSGDGYGTSVTAEATDGSGYSFRFAHMIAGSPSVSPGQQVAKGQQIGQVGSTGDSTGPHLHFETFPSGASPASYSGATDPVPVLAAHGVQISCQAND